MSTIPLTYSTHALPLFYSRYSTNTFARIKPSIRRRFRVYCQIDSKIKEVQIRRCSPLLESSLLSVNGAVASDEWKAIPDIWRSSSEKYGDKVALIDPYHDPPSSMTYKQLEEAILDFAEGLRVLGVKPEEKIALFADNSCRWLVADQGMMASGAINVVRGTRSSIEELFQIYEHSERSFFPLFLGPLFAKTQASLLFRGYNELPNSPNDPRLHPKHHTRESSP